MLGSELFIRLLRRLGTEHGVGAIRLLGGDQYRCQRRELGD
jgi:hypothetical protein